MGDAAGGERPVALVTGAAYGIGAAVALRMAAEGYRVGVTAERRLDEVAGRLAETDSLVTAIPADLSGAGAIEGIVADVVARTGRLDVLVNNAGLTLERRIEDCTDDDFDRVISINLKTPWIAARACVPVMRRQGGGAIVNVSSIHARLTQPAHSLYAASKGGLSALTRQLALELAPDGIRVNGVEPGLIDVPRTRDACGPASARIPAGRPGRPEEIANAVVWLAGDQAGFVTGELIRVDGGTSVLMVLG